MTSIATVIPFHGISDYQYGLLSRALFSIVRQTSRPSQIILSIEAKVELNRIEELVRGCVKSAPEICVVRNPHSPGIANNLNNGLSYVISDYAHILFYDDFVVTSDFYERLKSEILEEKSNWLVSSSITFLQDSVGLSASIVPRLDDMTILGINRVGPPSVALVRHDCLIPFDPRLELFVDVDWYVRTKACFGSPRIIDSVAVASTIWDGQTQNRSSATSILREYLLLLRKDQHPTVRRVLTGAHKIRKAGDRRRSKLLLLALVLSLCDPQFWLRKQKR